MMATKRIGRYEFVPSPDSVLGRGSYATVYRGKDTTTGAIVAVKEIAIHRYAPDSRERKYLMQEIAIMQSVDHPNIIKMYDVMEENGYLYLVLEYLAGGELHTLLQQAGPFTEPVARKFLCQIAVGLQYLHEKGIIHRDLKPHNLLLTRRSMDADVKIADFGFARVAAEMMESFLGSPLYMAPELLKRQRYNNKSDLWSVGVIFYELLTGKTPFHEARTHLQLLELVTNMGIVFPANITDLCRDLLQKLLQKKPAQRIGWEDFFSHKYLQPAMSSSSILENEETWVQQLFCFDFGGQDKPFYLTHKKLIGQLKYELQGYVQIVPEDQLLLTPEGVELEDHLTVEYFKFQTKRKPMYLISRKTLRPENFAMALPPIHAPNLPPIPPLSRTFNDALQALAKMGDVSAETKASHFMAVFGGYSTRASELHQQAKAMVNSHILNFVKQYDCQLRVFQVAQTYAIIRSGQISVLFAPLADLYSTVEPRLAHIVSHFDNVMKVMKGTQIHEALIPPELQQPGRKMNLLDFLDEKNVRANYAVLERGFHETKAAFLHMKNSTEEIPKAIQTALGTLLPPAPRLEMQDVLEKARNALTAMKDKLHQFIKSWEAESAKLRQVKLKVFSDADEDKAQLERLLALERLYAEIEAFHAPIREHMMRITSLKAITEADIHKSLESIAVPLAKLTDSIYQMKVVLGPKLADLNSRCDEAAAILTIPEQYSEALGELKRRRGWSQRMQQRAASGADQFSRAVELESNRRTRFAQSLGSHPAPVIQRLLPELVNPSHPVVAIHTQGLDVPLPEVEGSYIGDDDFALIIDGDGSRTEELERENAKLKSELTKLVAASKGQAEQKRLFAGIQRIAELEEQVTETKQTFDAMTVELNQLRAQQKAIQDLLQLPKGLGAPDTSATLTSQVHQVIQDRSDLMKQLAAIQPHLNQLPAQGAGPVTAANPNVAAELEKYKRELASAHSLINELLNNSK